MTTPSTISTIPTIACDGSVCVASRIRSGTPRSAVPDPLGGGTAAAGICCARARPSDRAGRLRARGCDLSAVGGSRFGLGGGAEGFELHAARLRLCVPADLLEFAITLVELSPKLLDLVVCLGEFLGVFGEPSLETPDLGLASCRSVRLVG